MKVSFGTITTTEKIQVAKEDDKTGGCFWNWQVNYQNGLMIFLQTTASGCDFVTLQYSHLS